jgi:3-dehydroquinate dehydratase-2
MKNILLISGPNLNLLGSREPEIYGTMTLNDLVMEIKKYIALKEVTIKHFQSNHEGKIIDFIHKNRSWAHGILINPGALTHYSYALRDAISAVTLPAVEVHLSDITKREAFRKISVLKEVCLNQISGLGLGSYLQGVDLLIEEIDRRQKISYHKKITASSIK